MVSRKVELDCNLKLQFATAVEVVGVHNFVTSEVRKGFNRNKHFVVKRGK